MTAIGPLSQYFNSLETACADATIDLGNAQAALTDLVNHTASWNELNDKKTLLRDDQITGQLELYRAAQKVREAVLDAISFLDEAFRICDIPPSKVKAFENKWGGRAITPAKIQLDARVNAIREGIYTQLAETNLALISQFSEARKPLNALICRARTQGDGYIKFAFDWIRDRDFVREELSKLREDEAPSFA